MLLENLKKDVLESRKSNVPIRTAFLKTLLAEITRIGFDDGKRETTESEAIIVVQKFAKNANEVIKLAPESINAKQAKEELNILSNYLPKQLSREELKNIIEKFKSDNSPVNVGQIMTYLKQNYHNMYDGKVASELAK